MTSDRLKIRMYNILQIIILLMLYSSIYYFGFEALYSNAAKAPAPEVTETYAHSALLAHCGLLFLYIPYYIIWKTTKEYNWKGVIRVHKTNFIIIAIGYILLTIDYWVAYKSSYYDSDINTLYFILINLFIFFLMFIFIEQNVSKT